MEFDDTLLADPARLADADTGGLLRATAMAGAQVRSCVESAAELNFADRVAIDRPRSLVLVARPGVGHAAIRLIAALLGPGCPVPVLIADVVPSWISALDVVYAHADDPGDRELATSLDRAARYGATMVLSAPQDGPVAASVAGHGLLIAPRVAVPSNQAFPRALTAGLLTVKALGLLDVNLDALADELDAEAEKDHLGHESFVNPAKALALRIAERTPLLWGLDQVATAVAEHAAHALATHASVVCDVADYRQAVTRTALHRSAVVGTGGHDIFADPDEPGTAGDRLRVLLLEVRTGPAVAAVRMGAEDMFAGADVVDIADEIEADEPIRAAVLALRFELAAVYLGLAVGSIGGAGHFRSYST
ncbi:MAG: SIS domain-containing protein [Haloechinothrix sp.]